MPRDASPSADRRRSVSCFQPRRYWPHISAHRIQIIQKFCNKRSLRLAFIGFEIYGRASDMEKLPNDQASSCRETDVFRPHETLATSQHYCIEGFEVMSLFGFPLCREAPVSRMAYVFLSSLAEARDKEGPTEGPLDLPRYTQNRARIYRRGTLRRKKMLVLVRLI